MTILRRSICTLICNAVITQCVFADQPITLTAIRTREPVLIVDCGDQRLPSMRSVGAVLQTNNATMIYNERERLIHIAQRECLRGYGWVVFARDAIVGPALTSSARPDR